MGLLLAGYNAFKGLPTPRSIEIQNEIGIQNAQCNYKIKFKRAQSLEAEAPPR